MIRRRFLFSALLPWAAAGCGTKPAAPPVVRGHVWYRGGPLGGGVIVFVPDEERGHSGDMIRSEIGSDGTFEFSGNPPVGWYRVAIAPAPISGLSQPTANSPYPCLPSKYRNPHLSGLRAEIKAGDNAFELELEDA